MQSRKQVRVRFAPSPTGHLHIGGARTALFNWLFARRAGGTYILRIEDTDRARSTQGAISAIIDGLKWLGLDWDDGPVYQSGRRERYAEAAEKLISDGKAYRAEGRLGPHPAVLFRVPDGKIAFTDLVYGRIEFDTGLLEDLVLMKSDGSPAYNFACIIDDADMEISHVIRGEDHISNTPKQLLFYSALEMKPPDFAHVPLILGPDGQRLSKRHGATSLGQFEKEGFLPGALMNFLALLGWSSGDDREIFSKEDLIGHFSIEGISRKSAIFDPDKLRWMNSCYIRSMASEELVEASRPFIERAGFTGFFSKEKTLPAAIGIIKERVKLLSEIPDAISFLLVDELSYDEEAVKKYLAGKESLDMLGRLAEKLEGLEAWGEAHIEECVRSMAGEMGVKAAAIIHPTRVAVTGRKVGPGLFELMDVLGKEKTILRLKETIDKFGGVQK